MLSGSGSKRLAYLWCVIGVAIAQERAATFEVASVKRNISGGRLQFQPLPGRLNATNVTMRFVIRQAYRVPEARIVGGPSWLDTDKFDIVAKAPSGAATKTDDIRAMLRTLLDERFSLKVHTEGREMPVYVLRVARGDRKLGPNMRESGTDCSGRSATMAAGRVQCGILVSQGPADASLRGGGTTLTEFVRLLGDFLDRPLVDETGLAGRFDLELQFSAVKSSLPGEAVPGGLGAGTPGETPVVFTAIQEQLGLKLESQRRVTQVYVIDQVSVPSEN